MLEKEEGMTGEVQGRVMNGRQVVGMLNKVMRDVNPSMEVITELHSGVIVPTVMYGSKSRTWTVEQR